MNLSRALITWCGCHGSVLTHVTSDDFALASDGVKYTPVAEREHADWQSVVKYESDNRKSLPNSFIRMLQRKHGKNNLYHIIDRTPKAVI